METRLVTAFFHNNEVGVPSHPFYLHNVIARYHRYQYSLVQLSKLGLPIVAKSLPEAMSKARAYRLTKLEEE